jgi:hypothetical protein
MIQHIVATVADFEALIPAIHVQILKIQKAVICGTFMQYWGIFRGYDLGTIFAPSQYPDPSNYC